MPTMAISVPDRMNAWLYGTIAALIWRREALSTGTKLLLCPLYLNLTVVRKFLWSVTWTLTAGFVDRLYFHTDVDLSGSLSYVGIYLATIASYYLPSAIDSFVEW